MRLWHYKLISYLPDKQLLAQKRECDLIWKDIENGKKTKHILIDYIWGYDDFKNRLDIYYSYLMFEFNKRGFNFKSKRRVILVDDSNYNREINPFPKEHTNMYLLVCFTNLYEKKIRGQKDFTDECFDKLYWFVRNELGKDLWDYL